MAAVIKHRSVVFLRQTLLQTILRRVKQQGLNTYTTCRHLNDLSYLVTGCTSTAIYEDVRWTWKAIPLEYGVSIMHLRHLT